MSFASRPLSHTKPNLSLKNISYISKLSTTSSNSRDLFHSKTSSQYHSSATSPSNVITKHANINLCKYSYQSNTKKNCMTISYSSTTYKSKIKKSNIKKKSSTRNSNNKILTSSSLFYNDSTKRINNDSLHSNLRLSTKENSISLKAKRDSIKEINTPEELHFFYVNILQKGKEVEVKFEV